MNLLSNVSTYCTPLLEVSVKLYCMNNGRFYIKDKSISLIC